MIAIMSWINNIMNINPIWRRDKVKIKILVILVSIAIIAGVLSGCIEEENKKPVAGFSFPTNTVVNSAIQFTDTSTDSDGTIEEWSWDFGDGGSSTLQNPTHTYTVDGTYTVKLTVTDNDGAQSTKEMDITIALMDIVETAVYLGFSTLATAVTEAGLVDTLKGAGPFTVFAPTDDAFAALNQTWLANLLDDITNLTAVLTYHVLSGEYYSTALEAGEYETVEGTNITIAIDDQNVTINGVKILIVDVECSNGIIHAIEEVILPASVEGPEES
jgi:uncharacterized surface protein with fasciclin (FAS1) repeats